MTTIGSKIIVLRKKQNLTQEKLSEKIGVSRQTLANWESNITSPTLAQASILANVFKIHLDELVDNHIEIECKDHSQTQILDKPAI